MQSPGAHAERPVRLLRGLCQENQSAYGTIIAQNITYWLFRPRAAPGRRAVPTFVATPHVWYPGATPTHSRGARSCRSTCCMCKSLAIMRVDAHHPVVSDESLPHADAAAFDAAGCRTTLVRGVRVVGGHGRRTSGVIRTVRARGGGEFSSGRRGATVDDERRVTTERRSTRWGARTAAAGCCSSTDDPPGS